MAEDAIFLIPTLDEMKFKMDEDMVRDASNRFASEAGFGDVLPEVGKVMPVQKPMFGSDDGLADIGMAEGTDFLF